MKFANRFGWALAGALALSLIATLAGAIQAGPLDPPGPVGSTMKTLADLVPAWHQTLSSSGGCTSPRFSCVMGGAAVLDAETGLVWQKTPSNSRSGDWTGAESACTSVTTGGREGWRLPDIEELLSLHDPAMADGLPAGHPFTDAGGHFFWSATAAPDDERNAQYALFDVGGTIFTTFKEIAVAGTWCVRGGRGESAQGPSDDHAWSKNLSAVGLDNCHSPRFTCVMGDQAVLDRDTGLVWERSMLSPAIYLGIDSSYGALFDCLNDSTGGVRGWRLPTVAELDSLFDPALKYSLDWVLPSGHPFTLPPNADDPIWLTSSQNLNGSSLYIRLHKDVPNNFLPGVDSQLPISSGHVWCVRSHDTQ